MLGVTKTDRIMWFSMWFLASIASFGLAFFPMFYLMIKRRNKHFQRHIENEKKSTKIKNEGIIESAVLDLIPERNAKLWTLSIFLVFPVFIIIYLLTKDLIIHEKHQQKLYLKKFPEIKFHKQKISLKKYIIITLVTLGVGVIYWLYKTMNIYNAHFILQEKIEREISKLEEVKKYV